MPRKTAAKSKPSEELETVPLELIQSRILVLRGVRVMLDADLVPFYRVSTSRFNEAVKRKTDRFPPDDFRFQLTMGEAETCRRSRSQIAILKRGQNVKLFPWVFTERGGSSKAHQLFGEQLPSVSAELDASLVA